MASRSVRRFAVTAGTLLVAFASPARGQSDLESAIRQHAATTIPGYVRPLADVLVANLSLGFVTSTPIARRPSVSLEAVAMTAVIEENLRVYTASTPPGFQPSQVQAPTVFGGAAQTVSHSTIPGLTYRGPDGFINTDYFPSATPQLRVGGLLGTELVVRYMSATSVPFLDEDFPKLTLFGVGIQHSLSQYFIMLPIDVSVTGSVNSLTFGDILDLSATSFGLNVGKSLGMLGASMGVVSDGGSMNVTYTSTDPNFPGTVNVDLSVKRALRFRGGASLSLGLVRFFGDAAFGGITSYAAGFRVGF